MAGRLLGLRKFIEESELPRIRALAAENPEYFYDVLPYASVFGLEEEWAGRFDGMAVPPPVWYGCSDMTVWNVIWFSHMMHHSVDHSMTQLQQTVAQQSGGSSGGGGSFGGSGGGFSGGGFGGGQTQRSGPRRGENLRVRLNITFEEAAFGCEKEINVGRVEQCPDCKGTGCAPGTTPEVCPDCKGTGSVRTTQRTPFGVVQTSGACKKCGGRGKIIHQPCPRCGGRGAVRKNQTIKVKIPAGIDDGQALNLRGKGNAGLDGGPAGDLLITVFVKPHPLFERDGNSVLMEMPVSFAQAALGAEIEVPTIDGRVKLTIPEGTQPGSVFRLRGKGIPYLQSKGGGRGDQFVTITVTVPKNMTSEQKERLRAYAEAMNESVSEGRSGIFGSKKKR